VIVFTVRNLFLIPSQQHEITQVDVVLAAVLWADCGAR